MADAPVVNPNQPIAHLAKAFRSSSVCYHPDAPDLCRGKVISSHTVQRNGPLRRIARKGHVYGYRVPGGADEEQLPKLIGIRDASTFPGFCSAHDSQLFAPVEIGPIEPTPQAAFLLAYRALVYELHQKKKSCAAAEVVSTLDRGRPLIDQAFVQQIASNFLHGAKLAESELDAYWHALKEDYRNGDYSRLQSVFIFFDRILPFVSSFFTAPYQDFYGRQIQGWFDSDVEYVAFSSIVHDEKSLIILSWDKDSKLAYLGDQMAESTRKNAANMLFQFALANSENVFLAPEWYEGLGDADKITLGSLFRQNLPDIGTHAKPPCLRPGLISGDVARLIQSQRPAT